MCFGPFQPIITLSMHSYNHDIVKENLLPSLLKDVMEENSQMKETIGVLQEDLIAVQHCVSELKRLINRLSKAFMHFEEGPDNSGSDGYNTMQPNQRSSDYWSAYS